MFADEQPTHSSHQGDGMLAVVVQGNVAGVVVRDGETGVGLL